MIYKLDFNFIFNWSKCITLFLLITINSKFNLFAGNEPSVAGGGAAGIGGAAITYSDVWSSFNNQAGLAQIKKFSAGIFNESSFLLNELSTRGIAIALPTRNSGVFGLSVSYFGYNLYNEKKIGLAYSKSFGEKISAGIQIDYLGTSIAEGYGSKTVFTAEAGFRAELIQGLFFGFHIFNPTRVKLADYDDERIPTVLKAGLGYHFSDKVILSIESEKNIDKANIFKAGVEYHVVKILYLRGGISTNPVKTTFGFGLNFDTFKFDFAATFHEQLGYSPHISLTYQMK